MRADRDRGEIRLDQRETTRLLRIRRLDGPCRDLGWYWATLAALGRLRDEVRREVSLIGSDGTVLSTRKPAGERKRRPRRTLLGLERRA